MHFIFVHLKKKCVNGIEKDEDVAGLKVEFWRAGETNILKYANVQ